MNDFRQPTSAFERVTFVDKLYDLPDEYMYWEAFLISLTGVTFRNKYGNKRQELVMCCQAGERLHLVRQADKHDPVAIAVMNSDGEQVGWIPAGDYYLAKHMDGGGQVYAKFFKLSGGPDSFDDERPYGCVIEIGKYVPDPAKLAVFYDVNVSVRALVTEARSLETSRPKQAILKYIAAIKAIKKLDSHSIGRRYREVKYPINRLSLTLERCDRLMSCVRVIKWWQRTDDQRGIAQDEKKSVEARLKRVLSTLLMRYKAANLYR